MKNYILLFITFIVIANSCTSKKKSSTKDMQEYAYLDSIAIDNIDSTAMIDTTGKDFIQKQLQQAILPHITSFIDTINTVSMKGSLDYVTTGQNFQAGLYVRIERDSIIWISITYLGFEVARVFATPQAVNVYNKVTGKIETTTFDQLLAQQKLPIKFSNPFQIVQSFLFGSYLFKEVDSIQKETINEEYLLFHTIESSNVSIFTNIFKQEKVYYPKNIQIPNILNYILQINYEDWNLVKSNRYFSLLRKLLVYDVQNTQSPLTTLTLSFTDAKFNEKLSFPFPKIDTYSP